MKEQNKLIAEFMGLWYTEENYLYNPQFEKAFKDDELLYNISWDWLIPVIDKIYSSDYYIKYKESLGQFGEGIFINTKFIISTYNDVIEFINWYNQQN